MDSEALALGKNQVAMSHDFTRVEFSEVVLIINWTVYQRAASAKPEIDYAQFNMNKATAEAGTYQLQLLSYNVNREVSITEAVHMKKSVDVESPISLSVTKEIGTPTLPLSPTSRLATLPL